MVRDIRPGPEGGSPKQLTEVDGALLFTADDGAHGVELWRSDGTEQGTGMVQDLRVGAESSAPYHLIVQGGKFFFFLDAAPAGVELWRSDAVQGSWLVKRITSSDSIFEFEGVTGTTSLLFFVASTDVGGRALWRSDGTEAGTFPLAHGNPLLFGPRDPVALDEIVVFVNSDLRTGTELWRSDGTPEGTVLVKDILSAPGNSAPADLVDADGTLFFTASDAMQRGIWRSDGREDGTVLLKQFVAPDVPADRFWPQRLTSVNGSLFFAGYDAATGVEPWWSDGTPEGTVLLRDIHAGANGSDPVALGKIGDELLFFADDGEHDRELWRTDGTTAGTLVVRRGAGLSRASGTDAAALSGTLFFFTGAVPSDEALWRTDGTPNGTFPIKDHVNFGQRAGVVGSHFLFTVGKAPALDLWRTDGSLAGTQLVRAGVSSAPISPIAFGDLLVFSACTPATGCELWRSDGTEGGTTLIRDINPGPPSSSPQAFVVVNDTLFFLAGSTNGSGLWRSDGTEAGTTLVTRYAALSNHFVVTSSMVDAGGMLLFATVADPRSNMQVFDLWRSDGTASGTTVVQRGLLNSSDPWHLSSWRIPSSSDPVVSGAYAFFAADSPDTGRELWALPLAALSAACVGDCDGSHTVTVDELVRGVSMALGSVSVDDCTSFDVNRDDAVTVDELVAAVGKALNGC
jgi:ELWxxDGT repeat protein